MGTVKITIRLGQRAEAATLAPGTSISGSDAMELTIDSTRMRKGDALLLLDKLAMVLFAKGFDSSGGSSRPANIVVNASGGAVRNASGGYILRSSI